MCLLDEATWSSETICQKFRLTNGVTIPVHTLQALEGQVMSMAAQVENAETSAQTSIARLGRWTALLLALLAATTFACGIATPPRSGPFCTGQCMAYPYDR